jgi:hypothetical protein
MPTFLWPARLTRMPHLTVRSATTRAGQNPGGLACGAGSREVRTSVQAGLRPNPQMQPTGRGGPELRSGVALLVARQRKRSFVRAVG